MYTEWTIYAITNYKLVKATAAGNNFLVDFINKHGPELENKQLENKQLTPKQFSLT